MDPIRNIIKVRVNNQDYLYQYENAWDKEKQRSYSKHRITVGKLVDGKVQLGRKFLTKTLNSNLRITSSLPLLICRPSTAPV